MPAISLLQAKIDMLAQRELPAGYLMDVDGKTDNIIVRGPTLGFCVTRKAVEEGYHKTDFIPALEGLIEAETTGQTSYRCPPIGHARL